jgi:hypothetical protein
VKGKDEELRKLVKLMEKRDHEGSKKKAKEIYEELVEQTTGKKKKKSMYQLIAEIKRFSELLEAEEK